jgi:hypothetical protein
MTRIQHVPGRPRRRARMKQPLALALMTGIAAIAAVVSLPVGLMELGVTSSGLSELFPAAAPPLGWTARAILAGFAGVMGFGIGLVASRMDAAEGEEQMGFAFSKLAALPWTRRRTRDPEMPVIRRADAHPDAPPRRPIFASSDFDAPDFFTPPASAVAADTPIALGAAAPADEPEARTSDAERDESEHFLPADDAAAAPAAAWPYEPSAHDVAEPLPSSPLETPSPLHGLSVAELAHRLETALSRRDAAGHPILPAPHRSSDPTRVLADIPPAAPVPVKPGVDAEVDDALRQALGALQKISGGR